MKWALEVIEMLGKKSVLLISSSLPHPATNGGSQRTRLLIECIKKNFDVDLMIVRDPREIDDATLMTLKSDFNLVSIVPPSCYGERGIFKYIRFLYPKFVDRFAHHLLASKSSLGVDEKLSKALTCVFDAKTYDLVVTRYLRPACLTGAFSKCNVVVDIDDLESEVWKSRLNSPYVSGVRRLFVKRHAKSFEKNLPRIVSRCSGVWFAKESDVIEGLEIPFQLLPNIPYNVSENALSEALPVSGDKRYLLGVATFSHAPNKEGFDYFIKNIWPLVIQRVPEARLVLIGAGLDDETRSSWEKNPGVDLLGFVSCLDKYYQEASFSIAPIFSGGGSNIKVLESLAHGRCCVCTKFAARGFNAVESIVTSRSDKEFADHCIEMLTDEARCREIGLSGYEYARVNFSSSAFDDNVNALLSRVLD